MYSLEDVKLLVRSFCVREESSFTEQAVSHSSLY